MPVFNSARLRETPKLESGASTWMELGATNVTLASAPGPALNFDWSSVPGPYWAELLRPVSSDSVSPYDAAFQARLNPSQKLQLSVFGSTAQGRNSLYGIPFNQVSGYTTKYPITHTTYASESDPGPYPVYQGIIEENWPVQVSPVSVTNGSPTVTSAGLFTAKVMAGGLYQFTRSASAPFYTVVSVDSTSSLTLDRPYEGSPVVSEDMWGPHGVSPDAAAFASIGGDHHVHIIERDESTGSASYLYEIYQLRWDGGAGVWKDAGGAVFNLYTGAQRQDGWTSGCAAGTPTTPFILRYDEILSGVIRHPIRCSIATGYGLNNAAVWPATHSAGAVSGSYTSGLLPQGARLRLKSSWLAANKSSYNTDNQTILQAMYDYGLLVSDLTSNSIWVDGAVDSRWTATSISQLNNTVPVTAFELLDNVFPQYSISGPTSGAVGSPQSFTMTYLIDDNSNFSFGFYLFTQKDGGPVVVGTQKTVSNTTRSITTSWTPTSAGMYTVWFQSGGSVYWLAPDRLRFQAI